MAREVRIKGEPIAQGTRQVVAVPVTVDLNGAEVKLHIHAVAGRREGPTLALLSTLHGSEFLTIEMIRRVVASLDPEELAGTVLAVPVGNPVALQSLTRNTRDESDSPDLNRAFPGGFTWITDQIAAAITENVLKNADYLMDFHMGLWGSVMGAVMYGTDFDPEVVAKSRDMAFAFGYPCVQSGKLASSFPGPRSSCGYGGKVLNIPNLAVEIGGAGFDKALEESWLRMNLDGIRNVMVQAGMLAGELTLPERYLVWEKRWRVNPRMGGYLVPGIAPQDLMREVKKGEVLGRVISPYTFELLEELTSPGDGVVFFTCRDYPVRPGDWAYGVIDAHDENTKWVDNPLKGK